MTSGRLFQFEFPAIERHHLVDVRDADLFDRGAVVLPDIDRFLTVLRNQGAGQIRTLADRGQRQSVHRFEKTVLIIETNPKIDNRLYVVRQRIGHQFYLDTDRIVGRRSACLAQILQLQLADQETARVIFPAR